MNEQPMLAAAVIAVIVESIVETIMWLIEAVRDPATRAQLIPRALAIVTAIVLCVMAAIDIFPILGVPLQTPIIGAALTGLLLSRGANIFHDLIAKLRPPAVSTAAVKK